MVKQINEACIAVDLPKALAQRLVEQLQCGRARFFCWEIEGLVTIFMFADSSAVHEHLAASVRKFMHRSMQRIPGDSST